ncbi:hypothetical protein BE61_20510 [Bradyrhizobium elkanii USDA 61]|nr:hypothetical protein BE61_20510 [Bradyrhizobium elkanii USDA 61]
MWETVDIRNEAGWLGTPSIEAKVAHDALAITSRVCREMTLRRAPCIEECLIEVGTAGLLKKPTQTVDYALLIDVGAAE